MITHGVKTGKLRCKHGYWNLHAQTSKFDIAVLGVWVPEVSSNHLKCILMMIWWCHLIGPFHSCQGQLYLLITVANEQFYFKRHTVLFKFKASKNCLIPRMFICIYNYYFTLYILMLFIINSSFITIPLFLVVHIYCSWQYNACYLIFMVLPVPIFYIDLLTRGRQLDGAWEEDHTRCLLEDWQVLLCKGNNNLCHL